LREGDKCCTIPVLSLKMDKQWTRKGLDLKSISVVYWAERQRKSIKLKRNMNKKSKTQTESYNN
jgi:hypothetical protein